MAEKNKKQDETEAPDETQAVDDIVVTARRREESLKD